MKEDILEWYRCNYLIFNSKKEALEKEKTCIDDASAGYLSFADFSGTLWPFTLLSIYLVGLEWTAFMGSLAFDLWLD